MNVKYSILLVVSLIILSILSYKLSLETINSNVSLPKPALNYNLHRDIVYKNTPEKIPLKLHIYQPKKISRYLNELFRSDAHPSIQKWFKFYYPKILLNQK